jgi:hypothetical protein
MSHSDPWFPGQRVRVHQDDEISYATVVEDTGAPTKNKPGTWVDIHKDGSPGPEGVPSYLLEVVHKVSPFKELNILATDLVGRLNIGLSRLAAHTVASYVSTKLAISRQRFAYDLSGAVHRRGFYLWEAIPLSVSYGLVRLSTASIKEDS